MIRIENVWTGGFEGALRGMRNPYESHEKSDSGWCSANDCRKCRFNGDDGERFFCLYPYSEEEFPTMSSGGQHYVIGPADMELAKKLIKAGPEHRKFLRMIHVQADVVAPSYFMSELDTYKIGTTRNSSSLMHLGAKRDYTIRDFSIDDERVYEILDWQPTDHKAKHPLIFSEDGNNEFKIYECGKRAYKVFKNGRIVRCAFDVKDTGLNRVRHFAEKEIMPTQNPSGYYQCNLGGGGYLERWMIHRLVAMLWHPDTFSPELTVNHIDHQKGNNHADNLEWVTLKDNIKDEHENGCSVPTLHSAYMAFKAGMKIDPATLYKMKANFESGLNYSEVARKYCISQGQAWTLLTDREQSPNRELFIECYIWEKLIDELNRLRQLYKETNDYTYFRALRQLMPMSFNYHSTLDLNYECLLSIHHQRKNHRLSEWRSFCQWVESLPYMAEFLEAMNG